MHNKLARFLESAPTEKALRSGKGKTMRRASSAIVARSISTELGREDANGVDGSAEMRKAAGDPKSANRDYQEISRALNLHKVWHEASRPTRHLVRHTV